MHFAIRIKLVLLVFLALLAGCAEPEQDFCQYLSVEEAQAFDPNIYATEMRQTERVLYCVYKDDTSDRLFISLDRALKYAPKDFLQVVAKNSPEKNEDIVSLSNADIDAAALFLGNDDEMNLDFLIAQNSDYSVTIRAHDVTNASSAKIESLQKIAALVLSRI